MDINWEATFPSPNPATYSGLYAVAQPGRLIDVWAVGYYYSNGGQLTLIEHWDGNSWSIVPSPNVGNNDLLTGVAVVPNSPNVWAVGYYYRNDGNPSTPG